MASSRPSTHSASDNDAATPRHRPTHPQTDDDDDDESFDLAAENTTTDTATEDEDLIEFIGVPSAPFIRLVF